MADENIAQTVRNLTKQGMTIVDEKGKVFSREEFRPVIDARMVMPLELHSLSGLLAYAKSEWDIKLSECVLVVVDENRVELCGKIMPDLRFRDVYARATPLNAKEFPFGQWLDIEDFIIKVSSQIVENDDSKRILAYVRKMTASTVVTLDDDGITQQATLTRGTSGALKENTILPVIVKLAPYRIFRELVQPESDFLFRVKAVDGRTPVCALFEADGGAWRYAAMDAIDAYLEKTFKEVNRIA